MKLSKFAEVMLGIKDCLIGLGVEPKEAQEMINKHYNLIKPHLYTDPIQDLVVRIIVENNPAMVVKEVEESLRPKAIEKVDAFFDMIFKSHKRIEQNINNFVNHTPRKNRYIDDFYSDKPKLWECDPFTGIDMYGRSYIG